MSDYLWDKQGPPDADVEALEQLLAPLASRPSAPPPLPPRRSRLPWIAAGAVALSAIAAIVWLRPRPRPTPPGPSWAIRVSGGTATFGGRAVTGEARLPLGEWIETGASAVEVIVADIGSARLGDHTRARIVDVGAVRKLELARGTLAARIAAPPRTFAVQTPHALAIDLGCAFSLGVDAEGRGRLVVTEGAVALADPAHEVAVKAGAECAIGADGPQTPYASDASPAFKDALARLSHDPDALTVLLREARAADLPTLKLLAPASAQLRALVERRVEALEHPAPPPIAPTAPIAPKPKHAEKHGAKHAAKAKATKAAKAPPAKTAKPAPVQKAAQKPVQPVPAPAKKPALHHDSMQDLERSTQ